MLAGKNYALHAGILNCAAPLVRVLLLRIENGFTFFSVSPFPVAVPLYYSGGRAGYRAG